MATLTTPSAFLFTSKKRTPPATRRVSLGRLVWIRSSISLGLARGKQTYRPDHVQDQDRTERRTLPNKPGPSCLRSSIASETTQSVLHPSPLIIVIQSISSKVSTRCYLLDVKERPPSLALSHFEVSSSLISLFHLRDGVFRTQRLLRAPCPGHLRDRRHDLSSPRLRRAVQESRAQIREQLCAKC